MLALAQRLFCAAALVDETRVLKCGRGVIRRHGKQQLVDLGGKVGAIAHRSDQTALGIDPDGNDNTAARPRAAANVGNDFLTRKLADGGEVAFEPFRKCLPCVPPRDFDCGAPVGVAQTHKSEIQVQRSD